MRVRKSWKGLAALAMAVAMLFSQTAVYAEDGQPVGQAEAVGQMESAEEAKSVQYFDLYAQTEDGKPIDGIIIYAGEGNTQNALDWGNILLHMETPIFDKSSGEIIRWYDGDRTYDLIANETKDGYAKLLYNEEKEGEIWQAAPLNEASLDNGLVVKVKDWEGNLIGDIVTEDTGRPYVNYKVTNLKEGWDITLSQSEITSFYENPVTGEEITGLGTGTYTDDRRWWGYWDGEPEILLSITATRKSDKGLTPVSYKFGGTQDLVFQFDPAIWADEIKEIKKICFGVLNNVQSEGYLSYFKFWDGDGRPDEEDDYTIIFDDDALSVDFEKGEIILRKDFVSALVYDVYPSIGNTYIGEMTYIAKDGTEKTVNGDWYIKVLKQQPQPLS